MNSGLKISKLSNFSSSVHCQDCDLCNQLPSYFNCKVRFVVYLFKCNLCNEKYIGETSVWLKERYDQHRRSITKKDNVSALSQHLIDFHTNVNHSISLFEVSIIKKCKDAIDTKLYESICIKRHNPKINRRFELTQFNLDYQ